ncbi:MAG: hypothetical protein OXU20_34320, partial [Myxococcales bacterium]|nr:hypothetical protein [Myxococcales bacterium]
VGGGGGGGGNSSGENGHDGENGRIGTNAYANGGANDDDGGVGGRGGTAISTPTGVGSSGLGGGGGGGGGVGRTAQTPAPPAFTLEAGDEVSCDRGGVATTSATTTLNVVAGTTYYVLVKSFGAGGVGDYQLTTEWADDWAGCDEAPLGNDAFFEFDVTGAGGTVAIETNSSAADTAIALYNSDGSFRSCDDDTDGDVSLTDSLSAGTYYAVVREDKDYAGSDHTVEIGIQGAVAVPLTPSALECADGTSGTGATITRALSAGTYYVAITTKGTAGPFQLSFDNGVNHASEVACGSTSVDVPLTSGNTYHVVVKGDTSGVGGTYDLRLRDVASVEGYGCGDPAASDAYFEFDVVSGTNSFTLDASGSPTPVSYQLYRNGGAAEGTCITSGTNTYTNLAAGKYYVLARPNSAVTTGEISMVLSDDNRTASLDCANGAGTAGAEASITRNLPAGTYYVGLTSSDGSTGDYHLSVQNDDQVPTGATQVACGATIADQPVVAGRDYYVVVKGDDASEAGAFDLTITDVGSASNPAFCGASPMAPDAYVEFAVTGGSRDLTFTADAGFVYQVFDNADSPQGGCRSGTSNATLGTGTYYIRARGTSYGSGSGATPVSIRIEDDASDGSRACSEGTLGSPASLTEALPAGRYYIAVGGNNNALNGVAGTVNLRVHDTSVPIPTGAVQRICQTDYIDWPVTAGQDYYVVVKGDMNEGDFGLTLTDIANQTSPTCGDPQTPDAFYDFEVATDGTDVTVDPTGSSQAISYELWHDVNADGASTLDDVPVDPGSGSCIDNAAQTYTLNTGKYYVRARGNDFAGGAGHEPTRISLRDNTVTGVVACDSAPMASGSKITYNNLPAGTYYVGVTGRDVGDGNSGAFQVSFADLNAAAPAFATQLACQAGPVTASLDPSRDYYVYVKGATALDAGAYTLNVTDSGNVSPMSCGNADPAAPDAFYEFSIADAAGRDISLNLTGSSLDATFEVYRKADDSLVAGSCGTSSNGGTSVHLDPGTYYIRIKGNDAAAAMDNFLLTLRDETVVRADTCADGSIATGAEINTTLDTGTYYVAITGGRSWSPADLTNKSLWIDAADFTTITTTGALVDQLADKSGQGRHLTATGSDRPSYVGGAYPAVGFDGVDDVLASAGFAAESGDYSVFMVWEPTGVPGVDGSAIVRAGNGPGGWLVRQDYSDPGRVSLLRDADASGAIVYDATVGDRDIIGGLHRSTGDVETYLNGSAAGTDSKAQVSWDQYFVGGRESAGYGVPMKLHELIVVSGVLSAAERESLEGYLAHKWGVSSDLPAVHPEKSRSGASRLVVEDTSVGGNVADRVACAGAADEYTLDVPAVPGMDYYVVVKGQGAADRGLYDLSLTDIGAVSDEGCGVDPTSADAFYEFQIADAGGRDIRIDVTGSAVATPAFALFRDDGTLGDRSDDTNIGCATNSQTFADLPAGTYYVVAKSTTTENGEADKAVEVSIQDADGLGSLACDSGDSSNAGRITRSLPAGTYYVGVTGLGAGVTRTGTYELTFRDTATSGSTSGATWVDCAQGTTLDANVTAGNTYYVVVKGDLAADAGPYSLAVTDIADATTAGHGVTDIGCGTDATTPDAYFEFDVADVSGRNVTVDLTGTSYPGAFQLYRDAGVVDDRSDDVPVGTCQPFGHGGDVPASFGLSQGKYYLALRGDSAAGGGGVGPYDVQIRDDDDYGSIACADGLSGSGAYLTRVLQPGDYWVGLTGQTGASGNYQVTFRDTAVPVATGATPVACSDSMISASVDAGSTYYVVVKGLNDADQGDYALSVADATGAASFGCNDDTVAGDAFFEFRVDDPDGRDVTIDTEGSALDT